VLGGILELLKLVDCHSRCRVHQDLCSASAPYRTLVRLLPANPERGKVLAWFSTCETVQHM
jgi:hypothetical protein